MLLAENRLGRKFLVGKGTVLNKSAIRITGWEGWQGLVGIFGVVLGEMLAKLDPD